MELKPRRRTIGCIPPIVLTIMEYLFVAVCLETHHDPATKPVCMYLLWSMTWFSWWFVNRSLSKCPRCGFEALEFDVKHPVGAVSLHCTFCRLKWKLFQYHLSTAITLLFWTAFVIWRNCVKGSEVYFPFVHHTGFSYKTTWMVHFLNVLWYLISVMCIGATLERNIAKRTRNV